MCLLRVPPAGKEGRLRKEAFSLKTGASFTRSSSLAGFPFGRRDRDVRLQVRPASATIPEKEAITQIGSNTPPGRHH